MFTGIKLTKRGFGTLGVGEGSRPPPGDESADPVGAAFP
jgi:hypothetical protein